jgi:hypothetical protein
LHASDHLDSPTTVANPAADIADVYAWTAPDGKHLNLVMTVQGHAFSDRIDYVVHIDSGHAFNRTTASISLVCRFPSANSANCQLSNIDSASGNPSQPAGLESQNRRFRLYAGLRDDPFYNNVKGLLGAYQAASSAIQKGAVADAAGCAHFDEVTANTIRDQMQHTDGGAAQNLLYNWTVSAIVVSVDLAAVSKGGKLLAVWGATSVAGKQLDRMARPFVGNTLLGASPFSTDDASGALREHYNEAVPAGAAGFVADLQKGLAFQDSLDGKCGNQLLADAVDQPSRYRELATLFADDRLWVNTNSTVCTQFFAVELAAVGRQRSFGNDCGGRAPTYDTSNVWRSLLIAGTTTGVTDGLHQDEHAPSDTAFPFLAPPDPAGVNH